MASRVCRCPLALVLIVVVGLPGVIWGQTTVGVYDENIVEPNTVEFTADGSGVDFATFRSHITDSFTYGYGGVVDASTLAVDWSYGAGATKSLSVQATSGSFFGAAAGSADCLPISGSGLWATLGSKHVLSIDLGPVTNGAPHEGVIEFGVTVLSRTKGGLPVDYGEVTGTARLSGGGVLTATRHIQEGAGLGDTFFGFVAPAGQQIRRVTLAYEAWPIPTGALCVDDLGFVTAPIPAAPTQIRWDRPTLDGEAATTDGVTYTVATDGITMEVSLDGTSDAERCGLMEFSLSQIPDDATIQSASLMAHVWAFSYHSTPEEFPSVSVYAHSGDGVLDPTDATTLGVLVGRFSDVSSSSPHAIDLDPAAIQTLRDAGEDLTLVLVQEVEGLYTTFITFEGGDGSYLFQQPTLAIEYDRDQALLTGDSDLDGDVDLDDFVNLKKGFNVSVTWARGDFDNDLDVDLDDFVILKKSFATTTPAVP